jgi:hypothetical protein
VSKVRLLLLEAADAKDEGWVRSICEVREEDEEDEDSVSAACSSGWWGYFGFRGV